MLASQARGYLFEYEVLELLKRNNFFDVKSGHLRGRGESHQIDAYGTLSIPTAFIYPIRLICEAKCYKKYVDLDRIRSFLGVLKDISENYFVSKDGSTSTKHRFTDVGCFFSANSFKSTAQNYAWAHGIFLVSFNRISSMRLISDRIWRFIPETHTESNLPNNKNELIESYKDYLDNQVNDVGTPPFLAIGIINNAYPIILVGEDDWISHLSENIPDHTDNIQAVKTSRSSAESDDYSYDTTFTLDFNFGDRASTVRFTLPDNIAQNIIESIDQSNFGDKVFEIDIPILKANPNESVRRVARVDIYLPEETTYLNYLKNKTI